MEKSNPLVSIIIPTYNRCDLLGETLHTVLAQTYQNWECIVVDDGSNDYTEELLESYCSADKRISFFKRPEEMPQGANSCRNYGFNLSKGEYINFLDSDDLLSINKISAQIHLLLVSGAEVATCKWGRFLKEDFNLKELPIYKHYSSGLDLIEDYGSTMTFFPSHSFLVKRGTICSAGGWNNYLEINQDGEFFVRLLSKAEKVVFSEDSFVLYRIPVEFNTSSILTQNAAKHLILSWKLIDTYLTLIDPIRFTAYIEMGKRYCCGRLIKNYPGILKENKSFLKKELRNYSILIRLKKKISLKLGSFKP